MRMSGKFGPWPLRATGAAEICQSCSASLLIWHARQPTSATCPGQWWSGERLWHSLVGACGPCGLRAGCYIHAGQIAEPLNERLQLYSGERARRGSPVRLSLVLVPLLYINRYIIIFMYTVVGAQPQPPARAGTTLHLYGCGLRC